MNWFKAHLNWTWAFAVIVRFATIDFDSPIPYIALHALFLIITIWVLHRKGRSWAWVLFQIAAPFLSNKRN